MSERFYNTPKDWSEFVSTVLLIFASIYLGFCAIIKRPPTEEELESEDHKRETQYWDHEYIDPTVKWDGHEYRPRTEIDYVGK